MSFPFKAVIFDWAYTLVDLGDEDDRRAMTRLFDFLRERDIDLPDFESVFQTYRDLFYSMIDVSRETHREACFKTVLNYLLFYFAIDIHGKTTVEEMLTVYYREMYSTRQVYEDTLPTLKALRDSGVRLGIISNTTNPGFMKDYEQKQCGLDFYFEFSIYSSEVPYRKPHPSIFELAIRRLRLKAGEILFVGDNLKTDVEGAGGLGMRTAWVNRNHSEEPQEVSPDYEIQSLTGLLDIPPGKNGA